VTPETENRIGGWRRLVEEDLVETLEDGAAIAPPLHDAMRHAVVSGGKRMRPLLVLASCHAGGGLAENAIPAATAVELVHAYSLVHDDLPAMDDDVLRRGFPTVHAKYGEALGILAGDALQTLAFETLAARAPDPAVAVEQVEILAVASGRLGMAGGQALDILCDDGSADLRTVEKIHRSKTGALLAACFRLGAAASRCDVATASRLFDAGRSLGLAFQIHDDVLDLTQPSEQLGKTAGKDRDTSKATWPAVAGLDVAKRDAIRLADSAFSTLEPLGRAADPLLALARGVVSRTK